MDAPPERRPPDPGTRVHVMGLGRSGTAAALLGARLGLRVTATDLKPRPELGAADSLEAAGVELDLGGHDPVLFRQAELVVVSPGVPPGPHLTDAREAGAEVISEVELAFRCSRASLVGITGSNGKSTVTSMTGAILGSDVPCWAGGNLGTPLSEAVGGGADVEGGVFVVELSSFQLEAIRALRCHVATILNITPDHLDRYAGFEHYADTKARIFETQGPEDHAVVLADEPEALARASRSRGTVHVLGTSEGDVFEEDGRIRVEGLGGGSSCFEASELGLTDGLAVRNGMVAIACSLLAGGSPRGVEQGLSGFGRLPHRYELVAESGGVRWIDDSKATNPASVAAALQGTRGSLILIAGGLDKKLDYSPLARAASGRVRHVLLIGQAAAAIEGALEGTADVERCGDLETAVSRAASLARPGDTVLLSPACASFDQFDSFEHRGRTFRRLVREALGLLS